MIGCIVEILIIYGVPLYYSLIAVKLGAAAPEENKKWSVYWLVTFVLIPIFYLVSFLGCTITSIIKLLVAVWLYHPQFEGALLINQLVRPILDKKSAEIQKIFSIFPVSILRLGDDHTKVE